MPATDPLADVDSVAVWRRVVSEAQDHIEMSYCENCHGNFPYEEMEYVEFGGEKPSQLWCECCRSCRVPDADE